MLLIGAGLYIWGLQKELKIVRGERDTYKASHSQCENDKLIAQEVSNDYQKKLSALDIKLRDLQRVYERTCIPIDRGTGRRNAASSAGELPRSDGIPATALLEYAGDAERVRLRLIACQDFITKISE